MSIDLADLSNDELMILAARIDKEVEDRRKRQADDALKAAEAAAAEFGFSLSDLFPKGKSANVKTPAPAKYKNPSSNETWSGRGRQPRWFRAQIDAGASEESLRIPG